MVKPLNKILVKDFISYRNKSYDIRVVLRRPGEENIVISDLQNNSTNWEQFEENDRYVEFYFLTHWDIKNGTLRILGDFEEYDLWDW